MNVNDNGNAGISKLLSYNANITNMRGMVKPGNANAPHLNGSNLDSMGGLMVNFSSQHDDGPRLAMISAQNKHTIPTAARDRSLFTTGADRAITQTLSSDFLDRAKHDGKVLEIDTKTGMMIVQYKNGTKDACDISAKPLKNGGGGFYLTVQKHPKLKVGQTFKKGEILTYTDDYFTGESDDTVMSPGALVKVAICSLAQTFEDSSLVTESFSRKMTSKITHKEDFSCGPNANVIQMVKIGQEVATNDPLITFDESFDDMDMNKTIAAMRKDFGRQMDMLTINKKLSKYTGTIVDIKLYYTCDKDELSPTLRKVANEYSSSVKSRQRKLDSHFKDKHTHSIILPPAEQYVSDIGKVGGKDVSLGVLFEFYIQVTDVLGIGENCQYKISLIAGTS